MILTNKKGRFRSEEQVACSCEAVLRSPSSCRPCTSELLCVCAHVHPACHFLQDCPELAFWGPLLLARQTHPGSSVTSPLGDEWGCLRHLCASALLPAGGGPRGCLLPRSSRSGVPDCGVLERSPPYTCQLSLFPHQFTPSLNRRHTS